MKTIVGITNELTSNQLSQLDSFVSLIIKYLTNFMLIYLLKNFLLKNFVQHIKLNILSIKDILILFVKH